eukprot:207708-Prymnesium_polylepis.1
MFRLRRLRGPRIIVHHATIRHSAAHRHMRTEDPSMHASSTASTNYRPFSPAPPICLEPTPPSSPLAPLAMGARGRPITAGWKPAKSTSGTGAMQ